MRKKISSLFLLSTVFISAMFLLGCKHEQIKFYRESAASSMMQKFNKNKTQVKTSSGMVIIKDENSSYDSKINFGPRDINFDLPAKFK